MAMNLRTLGSAYGVYFVATGAVLLPLLLPGFILTLDLVFAPSLSMPEHVTSSYLFHAALHVLNLLIPSEIIEKILLTSMLLLASIGLHRLLRLLAKRQAIDWGIYIASIFFAINPFTYSRFMAGQYAVLLGYALLPWLARRVVLLGRQATTKNALVLGGIATGIGIVSLHTLAAVGVLGVVAILASGKGFKKYLCCGATALGLFIVLSGYWLVPLALGQGTTASTIASFTNADTAAFATNGSNVLARAGNILRLQGFWAEGRGLYLLPQDRVFLWGLMALGVIALVAAGAVRLWHTNRLILAWLGGSAVCALLVASGVLGTIPLAMGLREPHKLVALVALAYSVFLAFGINALLAKLSKRSDMFYNAAAVMLLVLPFLFMRVMVWGFDGQLSPRHYPPDWFTVRHVVAHNNPAEGQTLFVPWHQYMSFHFAGRVIANPAPTFFGPHIVASTDPELGGASGGPRDAKQASLTKLLKTHDQDLARELAQHNIRYVLLAKELDYQKYRYLERQPGLTVVHDYPTLKLYKNETWRQP